MRLDRRAWRRESGALDDGEWVSRWTLCVGSTSSGGDDGGAEGNDHGAAGNKAASASEEAESFVLVAVASR